MWGNTAIKRHCLKCLSNEISLTTLCKLTFHVQSELMQRQQVCSKQHGHHLLLACEGMSGQVLLVWALAPLIHWGVFFSY